MPRRHSTDGHHACRKGLNMKVCVIGGNGQIGNYLLPRLVNGGHEVISVCRGNAHYFRACPEFASVKEVHLTRGTDGFEEAIAALGADVVIDIICFTRSELQAMAAALNGKVSHYLVIGSMWIHGESETVPVREEECRSAIDEYGRNKLAMADEIHRLWEEDHFPCTIVHPGHIVAPGHSAAVGPQGNRNDRIYEDLRDGREVILPNLGLETLHHVHADDIAKILIAAMEKGAPTFGEEYHAVCERAISLVGFCRMVAGFYGKSANLRFVTLEEFKKQVTEEEYADTFEHISHSPSGSAAKTKEVLGISTCSEEELFREHLQAKGLL